MHDICSFVIFLTSGSVKYAKYESTINYTRPLLFTTINSVNNNIINITLIQETLQKEVNIFLS